MSSYWQAEIHEKAIYQTTALNVKDNFEMMSLHYRLGFLMEQQDFLLDSKETSFCVLSIISSHKLKCTDKYCFCKRRSAVRSAQSSRLMVEGESLRRFVIMEIHLLSEYLISSSLNKLGAHWWVILAHILYSLGELDQSMLAFSQLNKALYTMTGSSSGNVVDSKNTLTDFNRRLLKTVSQFVKLRMSKPKRDGINLKQPIYGLIVESFLQSEEKLKIIKKQLNQLLDQKIKLNEDITSEKFDSATLMYNSCHQITKQILITEHELKFCYSAFPSVKQRSCMSFFQAELLSNYYKADYSFNQIVHNKMASIYSQSPIDFFSSDMIYLVVAYGKEKGVIRDRSPKAASFFGYERERFDQIKLIDDLMPTGLQLIHHAFVRNFFQTGQSGMFRNLNSSIAKLSSGFIQPIQLLFDVNFQVKDDFSFVAFLRKITTKNVFLIVSESGKIGGMTENFFSQIGASDSITKDVLYRVSQSLVISNMIPIFWDLVKQMEEDQIIEAKHFDVILRFIKDFDKAIAGMDDQKQNVSDTTTLKNRSDPLLKSVHAKVIAKKIKNKMEGSNKQENVKKMKASYATINLLRKNSFFSDQQNITPNSSNANIYSRSSISPNSNVAFDDSISHMTLNSKKTKRNSKSFLMKKTLGWKQNKLDKFETNMIIRVRNFVTDDSSISYKYFIVELEELKKAQDFQNIDSFQSMQSTSRRQSFVTMKTGKTFQTLASGSIQFSGRSNEEIDNKSFKGGSDEEFSNEKGSKVLSQETIKNEKSSYQKKSTFGENQYSTQLASIFSGKKQLKWVTRIAQQQKEEAQQIQINDKKFSTQNNQSTDENRSSRRLPNKSLASIGDVLKESEEGDEEDSSFKNSNNDEMSKSRNMENSSRAEEESSQSKPHTSQKSNTLQNPAINILHNVKQNENEATGTQNQLQSFKQEHTASFANVQTLQSMYESKNNSQLIEKNQSDFKQAPPSPHKPEGSDRSEHLNKQNSEGTKFSKGLASFDSKGKFMFQSEGVNFIHADNHFRDALLALDSLPKDGPSFITSTIQEEHRAQNIGSENNLEGNKNYFFSESHANILNESSNKNFRQDSQNKIIGDDRRLDDLSKEQIIKKSSINNHLLIESEKLKQPQHEMDLTQQIQQSNGTLLPNLSYQNLGNLKVIKEEQEILDSVTRPNSFHSDKDQQKEFISPLKKKSQAIKPDDTSSLMQQSLSRTSSITPPLASQQKFYNTPETVNTAKMSARNFNNLNNLNFAMKDSAQNLKGSQSFGQEVSSELTSQLLEADEQFYNKLSKCFVKVKNKENNKVLYNIRASKQYFVYERLNSFLTGHEVPQSIKRGLLFWLAGISLFLCYCFTLLFELRNQFYQFDSSLSLLKFQNEALFPLDMVSTLYLLSKQNMFGSTFIPKNKNELLIQDILFEVLDYSVASFEENIKTRLEESVSTSLWKDDTVNLLIRENYNQYINKNESIQIFLHIVISNMISIREEIENTSMQPRFDSFFELINLTSISEFFTILSTQIRNQNQQLATDTQQILIIVSVPMILTSVIVYLLAIYYFFQYKQFQESLLKFFFHSDKISLQRDTERYQIIKLFINDADDSLFNYSFSIKDKESFLENEDFIHESSIKAMKSYKSRLPDIQLRQSKSLYLFILAFLSYILFAVACVVTVQVFLSEYTDLLSNLKEFSRVPSYSSNVAIFRELAYASFNSLLLSKYKPLYMISYQEVRIQFEENQSQLTNFVNQVGSISFSLIDDSLSNQIKKLLQSGICDSIDYDQTYFIKDHDTACNLVQSGVLTQGIATSISLLKNQLASEYKETLFQDRSSYSDVTNIQEEALALFLVSYRISQLTSQIIINVNSKKDSVSTLLTVIICVSMCILGMFNFIIFIKGRNYLLTTYKHNKYLVLLLPQLTILMQPKFFSQFKAFLKQYDL